MRCIATVASALLLLSCCSLTHSAEPQSRWAGPFARPPMPPYSKHAQVAAYGRAVYPKYYWGLHSREFYNVGVPHGDLGLRGANGFTWNPW